MHVFLYFAFRSSSLTTSCVIRVTGSTLEFTWRGSIRGHWSASGSWWKHWKLLIRWPHILFSVLRKFDCRGASTVKYNCFYRMKCPKLSGKSTKSSLWRAERFQWKRFFWRRSNRVSWETEELRFLWESRNRYRTTVGGFYHTASYTFLKMSLVLFF